MKIAFLISSLECGGAERMVSRLSNEMVKKGHNISIVLFRKENMAYQLDKNISVYECSVPNGINTRSVRGIIERVKSIHKIIKAEKFDVLFAFMVPMLPFAYFACLGTKTKIIGAERANPKNLSKINRVIIKLFSTKCKGYIFQTNGAKNYYPKKVSQKGIVIGNIAPAFLNKVYLKEWPTYRMCIVGRLSHHKDMDTVIDAMGKVKEDIPEAILDIYGDGELRPALQQKAVNLGLTNNINFKGYLENVLETISGYDLFVFSSKSEGMPNVLLEAMAVGLECIATDCEYGPNELIENGKNGWLVPVGDSEMLAEKIVERLSAKVEEHNMICMNAQHIQENYSAEKIVNKYLDYAKKTACK